MPSPTLFQGNFLQNKVHLLQLVEVSSAHSCILSAKGETGGGMGQGNYALKGVSSLPWYVNTVTGLADSYRRAEAHEYIQLGTVW